MQLHLGTIGTTQLSDQSCELEIGGNFLITQSFKDNLGQLYAAGSRASDKMK
jgi:hypothetical protein